MSVKLYAWKGTFSDPDIYSSIGHIALVTKTDDFEHTLAVDPSTKKAIKSAGGYYISLWGSNCKLCAIREAHFHSPKQDEIACKDPKLPLAQRQCYILPLNAKKINEAFEQMMRTSYSTYTAAQLIEKLLDIGGLYDRLSIEDELAPSPMMERFIIFTGTPATAVLMYFFFFHRLRLRFDIHNYSVFIADALIRFTLIKDAASSWGHLTDNPEAKKIISDVATKAESGLGHWKKLEGPRKFTILKLVQFGSMTFVAARLVDLLYRKFINWLYNPAHPSDVVALAIRARDVNQHHDDAQNIRTRRICNYAIGIGLALLCIRYVKQ